MPADPVSVAVALADKIDMLTGFWAIDEKPTGIEGPLCAAPRGAGRDPAGDCDNRFDSGWPIIANRLGVIAECLTRQSIFDEMDARVNPGMTVGADG